MFKLILRKLGILKLIEVRAYIANQQYAYIHTAILQK